MPSSATAAARPAPEVDFHDALHRLTAFVESQDYRGYDPYDALNSPLLRVASLGRKPLRIAVIQAMKRMPFNMRPLLFVKKGVNPKGLGLFLWGYVKLHALEGSAHLRQRIDHILELIDANRAPNCSGNGWGYNFDWQSRAFFVPKHTPTIVNSSFVGHALLDAYHETGSQKALDLALPIQDFFLQDLRRTPHKGDSFCFSYTPIDELIVHNANLLGASFLIRASRISNRSEAEEAALRALDYSMDHQRPDGSWWYADTNYQQWIDSFHTGFNLQCIRYFLEEGFAESHREGFDRGVAFYADNFFLPDGTAKYFHDRALPLDVHSFAQAVVFFSILGGEHRALAHRVAAKMIEIFQSPKGYFYFQKRRRTVKIPYMRWSQSWAFHALTELVMREGKTC